MSTPAFRLAWLHGPGANYRSTRHGFTNPTAAARAARLHNPRRIARHEPPYSAVAKFEGAKLVQLVDLLAVRP